MTDLRTAAQQALEALKDDQYRLVEVSPNQYEYKTDLAIAALRAALAQQAEPVEPVAWRSENANPPGGYVIFQQYPQALADLGKQIQPLYAAPPQRAPLTEQEIPALAEQVLKLSVYYDVWALLGTDGLVALVRAVERAHGIGEQDAQV